MTPELALHLLGHTIATAFIVAPLALIPVYGLYWLAALIHQHSQPTRNT